jgi:AcrR family transcriptional regulator
MPVRCWVCRRLKGRFGSLLSWSWVGAFRGWCLGCEPHLVQPCFDTIPVLSTLANQKKGTRVTPKPKSGQPKPRKPAASNRPALTRQRVIDTATAMANASGVDALTIRKLATELDVWPMAIYHHLPNKDSIIDGMVDLVFSKIELPPIDLDWKTAIRRRSVSARQVLARHKWAAPMMESRSAAGPATLAHHEAVLDCLRNGGLSIKMSAHAYALIDAFIYGFALLEANLPATGGQDMADLAGTLIEPLPADLYPRLIELTAEHVLQPGYDFGDEFDFGLDLILNGLQAAAKLSNP